MPIYITVHADHLIVGWMTSNEHVRIDRYASWHDLFLDWVDKFARVDSIHVKG